MGPSFPHNMKVNSKKMSDLNIKPEIAKFLEKNKITVGEWSSYRFPLLSNI